MLSLQFGCASPGTPVKSFSGSFFKEHGGVFVQVKLSGDLAKMVAANQAKLVFENVSTGEKYEMIQNIVIDDNRLTYWQLPFGPYYLRSVSIVGLEYRTGKSFGYNVYVDQTSLANLGVLTLRVNRNSKLLLVRRSPLENSALDYANRFSGMRINNGYNGKLQRIVSAPKMVVEPVSANPNIKMEDGRARVKIDVPLKERDQTVILTPNTKPILTEMKYTVNLTRHSRHIDKITNTLESKKSVLQQCYKNEIDKGSNYTGTLTYKFWIDKNQGLPKKILPMNVKKPQENLSSCLVETLKKISFPCPVNLDGRIDIRFSMIAH